jgi:hypothetical protein
MLGAAADVLRKRFVAQPVHESFAFVLAAELGRTECG